MSVFQLPHTKVSVIFSYYRVESVNEHRDVRGFSTSVDVRYLTPRSTLTIARTLSVGSWNVMMWEIV